MLPFLHNEHAQKKFFNLGLYIVFLVVRSKMGWKTFSSRANSIYTVEAYAFINNKKKKKKETFLRSRKLKSILVY